MIESECIKNSKKCSTIMIIVDAQSVKNTDLAQEKGYDGGNKIAGIKRYIAVDSQGFLHAIEITTTNVTNRKGALKLF